MDLIDRKETIIATEKKEDTGLVSLTVRLSREQHEVLRKVSFDTRISIAEHIRRAIEKYLKEGELKGRKEAT